MPTKPKRPLWKTRTFWGGVLAIGAALVAAAFGEDDQFAGLREIIPALLDDPKLWVGVAAIFGRSALIRND